MRIYPSQALSDKFGNTFHSGWQFDQEPFHPLQLSSQSTDAAPAALVPLLFHSLTDSPGMSLEFKFIKVKLTSVTLQFIGISPTEAEIFWGAEQGLKMQSRQGLEGETWYWVVLGNKTLLYMENPSGFKYILVSVRPFCSIIWEAGMSTATHWYS